MQRRTERGGDMEYRLLGRSGLKISTFGLGTATFGGRGRAAVWGNLDTAGARQMIDLSLDAGVNWIDTANFYSNGWSEEICGDALQGGRRDRLLVFTKARFSMGPGPNDRGLSRHHLIQACEASLRRLKTDHIDLYQLHGWDGLTPLEETMEALDRLVQTGKVRYVGCSNFSAWHVMKALGVSERDRRVRLVAQQVHYTLQAREAENELVPVAIDQGVGMIVWSPLAGGWLSGKYRRNQPMPEGTRFSQRFPEPPIYDEAKLFDIIDILVAVAEAQGVSPAQAALAWLIDRPGVAAVVLGARTEAQLRDNLGAIDCKLTADHRDTLDRVSTPNLPYPYWHQLSTASDRLGPADLAVLAPHIERLQGDYVLR